MLVKYFDGEIKSEFKTKNPINAFEVVDKVKKHFDNFEDAMIAAVNHRGDSDSTGAVCGNILGSAIGYEAIPQFYKDDLEMHDLILHMADDLWRGEVTKM